MQVKHLWQVFNFGLRGQSPRRGIHKNIMTKVTEARENLENCMVELLE